VRPLSDPGSEHVVVWEPGEWMFRVFHAHPDPSRAPNVARIYGPVARFDPHVRDKHQQPKLQPDGRGVIYLGDTLGCGFAITRLRSSRTSSAWTMTTAVPFGALTSISAGTQRSTG
jgi:hypothetical protein